MEIKKCAVILAGGLGKRMRSSKPKVLSEVLLKPMLGWVLDACSGAGISDSCVVVGYGAEMVGDYLNGRCETALQSERLGTGHAVMMAKKFLEKHKGSQVLIACGDAPFLDSTTIENALAQHVSEKCAVTVISAVLPDPTGYGRIVRDKETSRLIKIVEQKDALPHELDIKEMNSGAYWFDVNALLSVLNMDDIPKSEVSGEYYLTETVPALIKRGSIAGAFIAGSNDIVLGCNDPAQLHELGRMAREKALKRHFDNGVLMPCADGIIISNDAEIGTGTTILPGTIIKGKTIVGEGCVIGPAAYLEDAIIGDNARIFTSTIIRAEVCSNCMVEPYETVKPGKKIKK